MSQMEISTKSNCQVIHCQGKTYYRIESDTYGVSWYRRYKYTLEFIENSEALESVYQEHCK